MNNYEVRVRQSHIDYYRLDAKDAKDAKKQVNIALASRIMGNIALQATIKYEHVIDYAVESSEVDEL